MAAKKEQENKKAANKKKNLFGDDDNEADNNNNNNEGKSESTLPKFGDDAVENQKVTKSSNKSKDPLGLGKQIGSSNPLGIIPTQSSKKAETTPKE